MKTKLDPGGGCPFLVGVLGGHSTDQDDPVATAVAAFAPDFGCPDVQPKPGWSKPDAGLLYRAHWNRDQSLEEIQ